MHRDRGQALSHVLPVENVYFSLLLCRSGGLPGAKCTYVLATLSFLSLAL